MVVGKAERVASEKLNHVGSFGLRVRHTVRADVGDRITLEDADTTGGCVTSCWTSREALGSPLALGGDSDVNGPVAAVAYWSQPRGQRPPIGRHGAADPARGPRGGSCPAARRRAGDPCGPIGYQGGPLERPAAGTGPRLAARARRGAIPTRSRSCEAGCHRAGALARGTQSAGSWRRWHLPVLRRTRRRSRRFGSAGAFPPTGQVLVALACPGGSGRDQPLPGQGPPCLSVDGRLLWRGRSQRAPGRAHRTTFSRAPEPAPRMSGVSAVPGAAADHAP